MKKIQPNHSLNELCDLITTVFCYSKDFYSNKDILEHFNSQTQTKTTMTPLGKALSSLGYERKLIKLNGKTVRGFYLSPVL